MLGSLLAFFTGTTFIILSGYSLHFLVLMGKNLFNYPNVVPLYFTIFSVFPIFASVYLSISYSMLVNITHTEEKPLQKKKLGSIIRGFFPLSLSSCLLSLLPLLVQQCCQLSGRRWRRCSKLGMLLIPINGIQSAYKRKVTVMNTISGLLLKQQLNLFRPSALKWSLTTSMKLKS